MSSRRLIAGEALRCHSCSASSEAQTLKTLLNAGIRIQYEKTTSPVFLITTMT